MRHRWLSFACFAIVVGMNHRPLIAAPDSRTQDNPRPNIVFIFSDDHACRAISAYGNALNQTPNIDRIAARGVLFSNSFCGNSICSPSRATVLTGKHSHVNGQRRNSDVFDGGQWTFVKELHDHGYSTALIGKWHLRSDPVAFDHWRILTGQGNYYNPVFRDRNGKKRVVGYATDLITDQALAWLDARDRERPFLLMVQHKAPHRTWSPAPKYLNLFDDVDFPEPDTLFDDYSKRSAVLAQNEMSIADYLYWDYDLKVRDSNFANPFGRALLNPEYRRMTESQRAIWRVAYDAENARLIANPPTGKDLVRWKYQRYIKDYLRTIASVDESVGRLLDALERNGLSDNTLVVYASDQGFYLGEHGWFDKRWMFEESLRMPLMMCWPARIAPDQKAHQLVQNIDYAPTFLGAAGLDVPRNAGVQGDSLLGIVTPVTPASFDAPRRPWREQVYYCYYETGEHHVPQHEGVRDSGYKLIYLPKTNEWQLFDLGRDPHELASVHQDIEYAGILLDMQHRLLAARKEYDANPWPLPEIPPRWIEHDSVDLGGFRAEIDQSLRSGDGIELGSRLTPLIEAKLHDIATALPRDKVNVLRRIPITIDRDHPLDDLQYHANRAWLTAHRFRGNLAGHVHVPKADLALDLIASNRQPSALLHAYARAYHDRVLGFDEPRIVAAYQHALASGRYESVQTKYGDQRRHAALSDEREFFAEMTEAYWGMNDFYPFVRDELATFDQETYALLDEIWHEPIPKAGLRSR